MSFDETSYVWLIDNNGTQYMCDGWPGEVTSVKLKTLNTMSGTPDKMPVPHSKTLTFTMTHNTDGTITLSYAEATGGESGGTTGGGTQGGTTTGKTIYFTNSSNWSKKLKMAASGANVDFWGTAPTSGSYTVEVVAQLSTGERPTIYSGQLAF